MTSAAVRAEARPQPLFALDLDGVTRVLTCGSVDDGKSTLIGRILWEIADLPEDQRAEVARSADSDGYLDFSLLVDGLVDERAQGITIDVAWRYFETARRRFVVIDCPGHEQYTRNMASGASHADIAILLIDVRHGVKVQTRRHAAILDLVGVRSVVVAVNKMDLVGWDEARFRAIEADVRRALGAFPFRRVHVVPISARHGGNVATPAVDAPWYRGPTITDVLVVPPVAAATEPFRFPVQLVVRDGAGFRGLAGTVAAGSVAVGDPVLDPLSGRTAHVARLVTLDRDLPHAGRGQAVVLELDRDIDIARGAVVSDPRSPALTGDRLIVRLLWIGDSEPRPGGTWVFRAGTAEAPVRRLDVLTRLEFETLSEQPASTCATNDIATAAVTLQRPVSLDRFAESARTGTGLIVDVRTEKVVAACTVTEVARADAASAGFALTRALLDRGLCADIKQRPSSDEEYDRRVREVLDLLRLAGVEAHFAEFDPREE